MLLNCTNAILLANRHSFLVPRLEPAQPACASSVHCAGSVSLDAKHNAKDADGRNVGAHSQMKAYIHSTFLGLAVTSLLLGTGCRGIRTAHTQDVGGPRFARSDPAQIEILSGVPARPHIELGQVWAYSYDTSAGTSKMEDALRKEAAKLGADAFVVWQDRVQINDSTISELKVEDSLKLNHHGRTVVGAAIKYP